MLSFIFWNYIIYIFIFSWLNVLWNFKIKTYFPLKIFPNIVLIFLMLETIYIYIPHKNCKTTLKNEDKYC